MQVVVHLLLPELPVVGVQVPIPLHDLSELLFVIGTLSKLLSHLPLHLQTLLLRLGSPLHHIPEVLLELDVL